MGCRISSDSTTSSSSEQDSEAASSEASNLLESSQCSINGYGVEPLSPDSPSPFDRNRLLAEGGGERNPASAAPDVRTVVSATAEDRRRRGSRTEILRSNSQGSSGSYVSSSGSSSHTRHTEPIHRLPQQQEGNGRHWVGGTPQQQTNRFLHQQHHHQHRGIVETPGYLKQMNKQNVLKYGGPVDADGVIRVAQPAPAATLTIPPATMTERGKDTMKQLSKAYRWREQFSEPTSEFLALMDRLYMECQLHLTDLSSRGDQESRREADTIVSEMVTLRNYWGPRLLPSSTCNAFVRERIPLTLGVDQRQFRVDCAQFFEPVPFYGNHQSSCPGELMKLYRFSVYNVTTNEVVLRYYLERSNVIQLYHVLCFTCESYRGQVRPYGTEPPTYWEVRQNMLEDVYSRLLSGLSPNKHYPTKHRNSYPANTMGRPPHLQIMPVASTS